MFFLYEILALAFSAALFITVTPRPCYQDPVLLPASSSHILLLKPSKDEDGQGEEGGL